MKLFKKSSKLNMATISNEVDKYSEWKPITILFSDGYKIFNIQPYIGSYQIDTIIEEYGKFLEKYAKQISDVAEGNKTLELKNIMGFLCCFLIRYKTDILSSNNREIIKDMSDESMMTASINIIKLNQFDKIVGSFDKQSMKVLFEKFNEILAIAPDFAKTLNVVKNIDKSKAVS